MSGGRAVNRASLCLDFTVKSFAVISGVSLCGIGVIIPVDIVARNLFNTPLPFTIPYVELLLVVAIAGAIPYAQAQREHVAVGTEVTDKIMPRALNRWLHRVAMGVTIVVLALMALQTVQVAIDSWLVSEQRQGLVTVRLWPGRVAVALGFVLLLILVTKDLVLAWRRDVGQEHR